MIEVIADPLNSSKSLRNIAAQRQVFDPSNPLHREDLAEYLTSGRWIGQYHVEMPYTTVPETVLRKYAKWALSQSMPGSL